MRWSLLIKPCISKLHSTTPPPIPIPLHVLLRKSLLTRTSYWSMLRQKSEVKIRKIRISTFLQLHSTATRGVEETLTLRFRSFMYSALIPLLWRTTTFMSAAIDRSDARPRAPSLPFFSLYLPPLSHLLSALNGWEAETFRPLVCS